MVTPIAVPAPGARSQVSRPAKAATAEVLDDDGAVLDVIDVGAGGGMTRTPEGAAQMVERLLGRMKAGRDVRRRG